MLVTSFLASLSTAAMVATIGCSDPPPPKTPKDEDGVPANSLSEARLHGDDPLEKDVREDPSSDSKPDPTQPYMTKVGEAPPPEPSKPSKGGSTSSGSAAMTKDECERAMDRYLELEMASNPQLKGVPPEIVEQAKQMARVKHGEMPCNGTRAQYKCAMAATSTAAWQRCMK